MQSKQSNVSKKDKLKLIQDFLSGSVSLASFKPPQRYQVVSYNEDEYFVRNLVNDSHSGQLNKQQYTEWKATLRSEDTVIAVCYWPQSGNEPLPDESSALVWNEVKQYSKDAILPPVTIVEEVVTPEPPKRKKKLKSKPKEVIEESVLISVPKRAGKLSEYGDTWQVTKREYYLS